PRDGRTAPGRTDRREALRGVSGGVEGAVGDVHARGPGAHLAGDRVQQLSLRERPVARDVVGVANRALVIEREEEPVDDVRDVNEGKRVVARADDDASAG